MRSRSHGKKLLLFFSATHVRRKKKLTRQCERSKRACLSTSRQVIPPCTTPSLELWATSLDVYCSGLWRLLINAENQTCPENLNIQIVLAYGYARIIADLLTRANFPNFLFRVVVELNNSTINNSVRHDLGLAPLIRNSGHSPFIHVYMNNRNREQAIVRAIDKAIEDGDVEKEHETNINKPATRATVACEPQSGAMNYRCSVQLIFYSNL